MKKFAFLLFLIATTIAALALTRRPVYTAAIYYIETARVISSANGTVTNTFGITYSAAPKVMLSGFGAALTGTNFVAAITPSNCIINSVISGITNDLVIIGTP